MRKSGSFNKAIAARSRGRKPRPRRSVIQLRVRDAGKVSNFFTMTVNLAPERVMALLQTVFANERITSQRD